MLKSDEFGIDAFFGKFGYDTLDNLHFPISGARANAQFRRSTEALGGKKNFNSVTGNGLISHSWDRNTVLLSGETGLTLNGEAPSQDLFELGGFLRLSGYQSLELTGQNFAIGRLVVYHNFGAKQEALFGMPIYLAYGHAEGSRNSVYLFLGQTF